MKFLVEALFNILILALLMGALILLKVVLGFEITVLAGFCVLIGNWIFKDN